MFWRKLIPSFSNGKDPYKENCYLILKRILFGTNLVLIINTIEMIVLLNQVWKFNYSMYFIRCYFFGIFTFFTRLFTFGNFILVLKMAQNETLISIDLVRDKGYSMPYLKGRKVNGSNHDVEWTEWSRCITTRRQVHQSLVWESDPSPSSAGRLIEHHTLNTSLICEKSMGGWSL